MDISTSQKGSMLAAIATGYFFTQIPGGALADRFGPKNVMTGALFLSAICCILVPTAGDAYGLKGIWLIMALMGAVQGPMFPTSSVFLSRWMPTAQPGQPDEKAWGTSMLDVGISIGSLLIIPIVTGLAEAVGWQNTFRYVGVASLVFVALWVWLAASTPSECWFISQEELDFLDKNVAKSKPAVGSKAQKTTAETSFIGMPWAMARHPGLWAVFICHIAFNFGAYYLTNVSDISIYLSRLVVCICILNLTSLFTNDFNFAVVAHILQGCPRPRTQERQISPHVTTCCQPRDPNIESITHPSRV
jgi:MFS family permease